MKVKKPTQEAYQNELNIESVERSFILSARWVSQINDFKSMWFQTDLLSFLFKIFIACFALT